MGPVVLAMLITLCAGLATGIGSALAFFMKRTNKGFLALTLGFSAGVMLFLSFSEILPEARAGLVVSRGETYGTLLALTGFLAGMLLTALIDRLVPECSNPHDASESSSSEECRQLFRTAAIAAVAIALHNFPEGIAVFLSSVQDLQVGLALAIAVALHNIPEGMAISVPLFYATGSRKKAFFYSFLSGLAEPLGALCVIWLLALTGAVFSIVLAGVAGTMVFLSLDQLLPAARKSGRPHLAIYGAVAGMAAIGLIQALL